MYKKNEYADAIEKELNENDFDFSVRDRGKDKVFVFPIPSHNAPELNVRLFVNSSGDCKLRSFLTTEVPVSIRQDMVNELNRLNGQFRFVTLTMDEDGDVSCDYDFAVFGKPEDSADQVLTIAFLYADIADKCVPSIQVLLFKAAEHAESTVKFRAIINDSGDINALE